MLASSVLLSSFSQFRVEFERAVVWNPSVPHCTGLLVVYRPGDKSHGSPVPCWASSLAVCYPLINRANLFILLVS